MWFHQFLAEKAVFLPLHSCLLIKYTSQAFRTSIISILQLYHIGIISFHVFSRRLSKLETEQTNFVNIPSLLMLCIFQEYISLLYFSTMSQALNGEHCAHSHICEYFTIVSVQGYYLIFHMYFLQDITEHLLVYISGRCLCGKYI